MKRSARTAQDVSSVGNKSKKLPTLTALADFYELEDAARRADVLSPVSAAILEDILHKNPLDLLNRARLLGFYYRFYWNRRRPLLRNYRRLRMRHILWFIENAPDCVFAGDKYLTVDKRNDPDNYSNIAAAWHKASRIQPYNQQVRINAALFFFTDEQEICQNLLHEILAADPENIWATQSFVCCNHHGLKMSRWR